MLSGSTFHHRNTRTTRRPMFPPWAHAIQATRSWTHLAMPMDKSTIEICTKMVTPIQSVSTTIQARNVKFHGHDRSRALIKWHYSGT